MDKNSFKDGVFRVGFLMVDGFALMSYAAAVEPLRAANLLAGRTIYDIRHIPIEGARAISSSGALIRASAQVGEQVNFDLILVVAGGDPFAFNNERILQWLRHMGRRGVVLGGISGGAIILSLAGLMENRRFTVHWEHASVLMELMPDLLLERSLFVFDRDRITCGGGTAPLDMMHALILRHNGAQFAGQVSDWFSHTQIRDASNPQRGGTSERYGIHQRALIDAIDTMENHLSDPLSLEQLAQLAGISARQLNRLFQAQVKKTTMEFYRELRLKKAHNLLSQSHLSITQIALVTGFSSSAHFSQSFSAYYQMPPSSVRG